MAVTTFLTNEDNERLDGRIDAISDEIGNLTEPMRNINLIDPTTIVDNSMWRDNNPETANYSRTGKIAVTPNESYTFGDTEVNYWDNSKARFVAFFSDDGYLSKVENVTNFTTPADCRFVAITFRLSAKDVILIKGTYDTTTQTMVYVPYVDQAKWIASDAIVGLSIDKISDYAVDGKNIFNPEKATLGMYLEQYPSLISNASSFVSDYIPVQANISLVISHNVQYASEDYALRSYVLYDEQYQKVSSYKGNVKNLVITPAVDGYLRFCGYADNLYNTQLEVGTEPTEFEAYKKVLSSKALLNDEQMAQVWNSLYKKKWVPFGGRNPIKERCMMKRCCSIAAAYF
jgi:hypothetical protein